MYRADRRWRYINEDTHLYQNSNQRWTDARARTAWRCDWINVCTGYTVRCCCCQSYSMHMYRVPRLRFIFICIIIIFLSLSIFIVMNWWWSCQHKYDVMGNDRRRTTVRRKRFISHDQNLLNICPKEQRHINARCALYAYPTRMSDALRKWLLSGVSSIFYLLLKLKRKP